MSRRFSRIPSGDAHEYHAPHPAMSGTVNQVSFVTSQGPVISQRDPDLHVE